MKIIKRIISIKISCLLVAQQSLIAGGLTVDKTAPSSNQANLESARNGVPIVNIVAPNQKGLSHNKFSDYNVNKEGLILNNSNKREVNTQLSGYIYGNQNLKNGTAKTILNEVTSKNKSELKGFTEVAGDRANVVVANPNGIYINGAGFINTSRATITTGNPNIKNGEIDSFDVRQGQIDVDGEGLNLSNVNKAELYAQTVKLNAKIHAQGLDVVTGQNSISKDGTITNIENSADEKPTLSIDSSALGGIYANKISLVGTQKGVGVNLPIEISAQDDFKLSADGKIVLDKVISEKNIDIKSDSSDINSKTIYGNNVNIEAKNSIKNEDVIASKTNIDLKANSIENKDANIQAVKDITITSKNIDNSKGTISSNNNLELDVFDFKGNNSTIQASNIDIKANDFEANSSNIVATNGNLDIKVNNLDLDNSLQIGALDNVNIKSNEAKLNNTKIVSQKGNMSFDTNSLELEKSIVSASKYLDINTTYLKNTQGNIQALEDINITSKDIDNQDGKIATNKNLLLNSFNFQGDNSKLQASNIDVKANNFQANNSKIVAMDRNLNIESKDLEINNSNITSSENIDIKTDNLKSKNGNIQAVKDISIASKDIDNENGVIATNENLTINSSKDGFFNNIKGKLQSGKKLVLDIFNFQADDSNIQASNINIKANNFEAKSLNIIATNDNLDIETDNFILEDSYLNIKNNLSLNSKNSLNLKDNTIVGNNLNISADEIYFDGTSQNKNILYSTNDILINTKKLISNYLFTQANNNINIDSSNIDLKNSKFQSVVFIDSIYQNGYKQGDINLTTSNLNLYNTTLASKDINIKKGTNQKLQTLAVENSSLDVNNNIDVSTTTLNAKKSLFSALNDLLLTTDKSIVFLNNNFSANNLSLTIDENLTLDKSNSFLANNNFSLNTKSLVNNAQIISNGNLTINTNDFIVNNALISSKNILSLNATNYILNNDSNESLFGTRGAVTNLNTKLLTNYGFISSLYDMNIKVDDLINYAGIASANSENKTSNMNIEANNLTNYNTIYSNDNINLYVKNSLKNIKDNKVANLGNEKATIFTTNNITMQGNKDKSLRTDEIINDKSIIQTQYGDINIYANSFKNLNDEAVVGKKDNGSRNYQFEIKRNKLYTNSEYISDGDGGTMHYSLEEKYIIEQLKKEDIEKGIYYNSQYIRNSCGRMNITNNCFNKLDNTFIINNIIYKQSEYQVERESVYNGDDYDSGWIIYYKDRSSQANSLQKFAYEISVDRVLTELKKIYEPISNIIRLGYTKPTFLSKDNSNGYFLEVTNNNYYRYNATNYNFNYNSSIDYFLNKPDLKKGASIVSGKDIIFDVSMMNNYLSRISAKNNIVFNNTYLNNQSENLYQYDSISGAYRFCYKDCGSRWHNPDYTWANFTPSSNQTKIDSLDSIIEAGNSINGSLIELNNENKARISNVEFTTYSPSQNTKVQTANIQINKKTTENKNIEEKNTSTIKVENKVLNSDEIKIKDNEKIEESTIRIENKVLDKIVLNSIDENYILPTNKYSTFTTVNPNKNLDYLVESNPLYTNHSNFIGSSYFLEKMNFQGDKTMKRLGDAAYETKLVSDAIFKQTGQRFLSSDYTSENTQFVSLMDNAVNLSGVLGLELGKPLSKQQLVNLTEDIVWMEEKVVNGQTVLVPVVYLAKDYNKSQGAVISAKNIDLNIKDNLVNSGTIKTNDYLNLNANSITNNSGVMLSGGKATLISNDDFINKNGGLIKGSDIQIASLNGNVINETYSKQNYVEFGINNFTYTNIGKTSSIEATNGNLVIQAKNDITNIGGNLGAKESVLLQTQTGDINLNAIKLENGYNLYFKGGFSKGLDINYQTSNIDANNIIMQSGKDINLEASKLNATNQINLNAQNDVNIEALNNVYYRDTQTTKKGTFSKTTKRDMVYKESVNSAELNANDILINANNDVNLQATKLKAQDNIIVNAKDGNLNIVAKEYREGELHEKSKSSWGGLKKSLDISSTDALKLNSALLKTEASNVVLTSGKDINILASEINSGNLLLAKADNNLNVLSAQELLQNQEIHKKTSFSPSLSGKTLVLGKEKTTEDKDTISTQKSSTLTGKDVILEAKDEMTIIGSNVVGKNVVLNANDINILSATQSSNNEHMDSTKKIGVGVTLNSKEASIFAGAEINKNEINQGNTTQKASNIVGNDVTILSKNNTNIMASNILADNNLAILAGKNLNILSQEATNYKDEVHSYLKAGVSLGVKQNITQGVKDIANTTKNIANSDNMASAGFNGLKLIDSISSTLSSPVSAGLNIVAQKKQDKSSSTNQYEQGSNIYVGNNAVLNANEDINIKGSDIFVKNSLDIFAKNLNVEAASQKSNSNSSNKSLDLSIGLYGSNAGKVDVSGSKGKQNFDSLVYKNSTITSKDLNLNIDNNAKFEGANVKAENINAKVANNLTIASLQNSSNGNGSNKSLSLSTSQSVGVGFGKNESQRDWVDNQTTIIGTNSVNVNVGNNTHLKGSVIASGDYDKNGNFVDNKNLNLTTKTLTSENIYDKDKNKSFNLSVGVDNSKKETQGKMELGLNSSNKEQINYATIGEGTITTNGDIKEVNRDVNKSQVITKDESKNIDIYLSNTSINKALDPNQTIAKWTQDAKDLGLNVRNEIIQNLPSSMKLDKDGNGNIFDKTIGKALDATTDYGLGIIPTVGNAGGYVTQIATQLFGDNRTGIVVKNKDVLLKAGILEGDIKTETLVKTKDGIKKAQDVKDTDVVLDTVTVYRTDPDKTIIISENKQAIEKEQGLSNYNNMKIYLTKDDIEKSGIKHLFTNGMFNPFDTATYNQQTQQAKAGSVLNYNQTHGLSGDLLESAQDAIVVMGTKFMNFFRASSVNPYLSYLGTGGAKQTANLIEQMSDIKKGDLTVGGHSQGTLMTQLGLQQKQEYLTEILKNNPNSKFLVGYAGSPVNHYIAEKLLTDIYGGEAGIGKHFGKDVTEISNVFRSQVNPQDFVGSFLGGQSAGVNNSEKLGKNMWSSFISFPMLFDMGGDSSHSYYPCVIGCSNNNTTPAINYYFNKNDEKGRGATELTNYYSTQLPHVNQNLLPSSQAPNSKISIDTKGK
ncbi:hemagglutinin repeat-containing protein [Aliarcobacter butzleri]|uniref:two-partner secretion domain-containing protein n=1 Tax=Aliarcobacter butzleri TaxID=28197 RepID=UPI0021B3BEDA|nr:hemagglutinin repeat-containing protein [Aliarcobacter butzleri]MCT7617524.1 hemagglutinin repeat-containing protein [Aliarcobacter butzleri]